MDTTMIGFAAYEDATEYLGITDVTLPDIEYLSEKVSGAGIGGETEEILVGMVSAMTTTFNFRCVTGAAISLLEPREHNIDLRIAYQQTDLKTGATNIVPVKHLLKVKPKSTSLGKVESASIADVSGKYATSYYATYIDGKKTTEIDPNNFICTINGKDCLESAKKALGLNKKKKSKKKKSKKKK